MAADPSSGPVSASIGPARATLIGKVLTVVGATGSRPSILGEHHHLEVEGLSLELRSAFGWVVQAIERFGFEAQDITSIRVFTTIDLDEGLVRRALKHELGLHRPPISIQRVHRIAEPRAQFELEADADRTGEALLAPRPIHLVRRAGLNEFPQILALLQDQKLPLPDANDRPVHFHAAFDSVGEIIACAGHELHGPHALLRSVAVSHQERGRGVGTRVIQIVLEHLTREQIRRVWLFTTNAQGFFARFGFREEERERLPSLIRRSSEASAAECALATLMVRPIPLAPR